MRAPSASKPTIPLSVSFLSLYISIACCVQGPTVWRKRCQVLGGIVWCRTISTLNYNKTAARAQTIGEHWTENTSAYRRGYSENEAPTWKYGSMMESNLKSSPIIQHHCFVPYQEPLVLAAERLQTNSEIRMDDTISAHSGGRPRK